MEIECKICEYVISIMEQIRNADRRMLECIAGIDGSNFYTATHPHAPLQRLAGGYAIIFVVRVNEQGS